MVEDEVQDDLDPTAVGLGDEALEIVERPEDRIDARVVGDVVAGVEAG